MNQQQREFIEALFETHGKKLLQCAYRQTKNVERSKDLVQEVFYTASKKSSILFDHPNASAWLYVTLKYLIQSEMQTILGRKETPLPENISISEETAFATSPQDVLPVGLSEKDSRILLLKNDGYTYKEMSEKLECTDVACRQQYHRARKHCIALLEKENK